MSSESFVRPSVFSSFWLGGFESACHVNVYGRRLDMLHATQHDRFVDEDYARLREMGIHAARDAVRWHRIETSPGRYDFSSVAPFVAAAKRHGIQVIWDLCHYGWPDDVDVYSPAFVDRFRGFCGAIARWLREQSDAVPFYTPVNEISFLAWATGEVGWFKPYGLGRAHEIKRQLVRAAIAAIEAVRDVDPRARFLSAEPVIHNVPPRGLPDVDGRAAGQRASQFEAWDMLCGRACPELGGKPEHLDIIGVNFYHSNQWEVPGGEKIHWHVFPRDPRWLPFHSLLEEVYARYERPLCIAETSHVGVGRAQWIRELTDEVCLALDRGVPLEGICLYPVIDRFDWEEPTHWHNCGLWDFDREPDGTLRRVLDQEYAAELRRCQILLARRGCGVVERGVVAPSSDREPRSA